MGSINDLRNKLKALDIQDIAAYSLDQCTPVVLDEQKKQLQSGKRSDGKGIGKYRSAKYAAKKYAQNPTAGFGNVDLILTGEYSRALFLDVRPDSFVIESADAKAGVIFAKYGEPLGLGLQARINLIKRQLNEVYLSNIKAKLQL